jgi:predicted secreted protein
MHWIVLAGAFAILWFLALQILLPIGLGDAQDSETGAPSNPRIALKAVLATLAAVVIWIVFYALVRARLIDV